jgi:hypothetical protein
LVAVCLAVLLAIPHAAGPEPVAGEAAPLLVQGPELPVDVLAQSRDPVTARPPHLSALSHALTRLLTGESKFGPPWGERPSPVARLEHKPPPCAP